MYKQKIINVIKALLTTYALTLDLVSIYENKNQIPFVPELSVVFLLGFFFFFFYEKLKTNKKIGIKILSSIFTFFMLFGYSYSKIDSWNLVLGNWKMIAISIPVALGYFALFDTIISSVFHWIEHFEWKNIHPSKNKWIKKYLDALESHPMRTSFLTLIVGWILYMIAFYPIILAPDPSFQIRMYFNEPTKYIDWVIPISDTVNMTTHHPVFHTWLLGTMIEIGRFFGSDNFGLYLYDVIQYTVLALTLAYTISYTKKLKMKNSIRIALLIIYLFVPMYGIYAVSAQKDTYYTCFVILYTIFLLDLFLFQRNKKLSWKNVGINAIFLLFMMLFRNNGIHLIILSYPFLFFFSSLDRKKLAVLVTVPIGIYFAFNNILIPSLGISKGSIRENFSLPFQQTARYVRDHEVDLTDEDKAIIDKVLGYENVKENYQPTFADSVKDNYNKYTTNEDLKAYFEVWFRGLLKHPDTYAQATMNNVYGYFYPNSTNWYFHYKRNREALHLIDYHFNGITAPLRAVLKTYGEIFPYIPIVGLLTNMGFSTWVLFFLVFLLGTYKKKELWIVLLPSLISVLVCVASPVNTYFRYGMPFVFLMPFLFCILIEIVKKKGSFYEKKEC